ncbi:MAG: hypothetical protein GY749_11190 [Desulfobacteraceae bacterium]|nr:hypothetical protein [Desulfobacteraceae bacterium]
MEHIDSEKLLNNYLSELNFRFDSPNPNIAWSAFQRYISEPHPEIDAITITIGYECLHVWDRDNILWLSFMRRLEGFYSYGCLLSIEVPETLTAVSDSNWWWAEHGTRSEWCKDVQKMSSFQICMQLKGWCWEGFSE